MTKFFPTPAAGATGSTGAAGPSNVIQESAGPTSLTVGAVLDGEEGRRVGSTFVGRFIAVIGPNTAVSDPGDTAKHDVTGLTVTLPRAGTYCYEFTVILTVTVNPTTVGLGVAFSGTLVSMAGMSFIPTSNTAHSTPIQVDSDSFGTAAVATLVPRPGRVVGVITVSTSGTLAVRFSRASNAISFDPGGGGFVFEK